MSTDKLKLSTIKLNIPIITMTPKIFNCIQLGPQGSTILFIKVLVGNKPTVILILTHVKFAIFKKITTTFLAYTPPPVCSKSTIYR